jgi:cold shock CspA family protein
VVDRTRRAVGAPLKGPPAEIQCVVARGRIVRLFVGQGHGFIRMANGREVWFHRSDMQEGAAFNDFVVGDSVAFDLMDDRISGARALLVRRHQPRQ